MAKWLRAIALLTATLLGACAPTPLVRLPPGDPVSLAAPGLPAPGGNTGVDECFAFARGLSPEEAVGQLLMVGVDVGGLDSDTRAAIRSSKAGSVVLLGNARRTSTEILSLTAQLGTLGSVELPILVAADQEGGRVQRLNGDGYTTMPTAQEQGEMLPEALRVQAETWGGQLKDSGVLLNLAPSADVVEPDNVNSNEPIGRLGRNYGTEPQAAAKAVSNFVLGMKAAGVGATLKHFPGLGRATGNTDLEPASDDETIVGDKLWQPFLSGIQDGADAVMVSSAVYEKIDPAHEAVFSKRVITNVLRGQLRFEGLVIADDLGAAKSVSQLPPGDRALAFLRAGGDVVITADAKLADDMVQAVLKASVGTDLDQRVRESVARVLRFKESVGMLDCSRS